MKIVSEQENANEAIAKEVAGATRAAINHMPAATTEKPQTAEPKIGSPAMRIPSFNWEADYKYN